MRKLKKLYLAKSNRYNIGGYESIGVEVGMEFEFDSEFTMDDLSSAKDELKRAFNIALLSEVNAAGKRKKASGDVPKELKELKRWLTE